MITITVAVCVCVIVVNWVDSCHVTKLLQSACFFFIVTGPTLVRQGQDAQGYAQEGTCMV